MFVLIWRTDPLNRLLWYEKKLKCFILKHPLIKLYFNFQLQRMGKAGQLQPLYDPPLSGSRNVQWTCVHLIPKRCIYYTSMPMPSIHVHISVWCSLLHIIFLAVFLLSLSHSVSVWFVLSLPPSPYLSFFFSSLSIHACLCFLYLKISKCVLTLNLKHIEGKNWEWHQVYRCSQHHRNATF